MYGSLDISTSALVAHRQWMTAISNNLANEYSLENAQGEYSPYRAKIVVMRPGDGEGSSQGVHVAEIMQDPSQLRRVFDPTSPFADNEGYVGYPNVDPVKEQMNAMMALNAYQANITAAEATKTMLRDSLKLIG